MKTLTLLFALFSVADAQAPPQTTKPTREQAYDALNRESKEALVNRILTQMFPPTLVGKTLPAKLQTGVPMIAVFMGSACPHCAKEVPWFASLDRETQRETKSRIVPVFSDSDALAGTFLARLGWATQPVRVASADLTDFPVRGTPTTVLVDASGKVLRSFFGELSADERAELRAFAQGIAAPK